MVGIYGEAKINEWSFVNSKYTINADYGIGKSDILEFNNFFNVTISINKEENSKEKRKSLKVDKVLVISDNSEYDEYVNLFIKDICEFLERFSFCPEKVSFVI